LLDRTRRTKHALTASPITPAPPAIGAPRFRRRTRKASARQAAWRARQCADQWVAPVVVSYDVIAFLIDLDWLDVADSEDRAAIGDAIGRMVADAASQPRPPRL
jgi:hypothetical protein